MSDKPVWLETWESDDGYIVKPDGKGNKRAVWCGQEMRWEVVVGRLEHKYGDFAVEKQIMRDRARLAAAAPAMARALLALEWTDHEGDDACSACGGPVDDGSDKMEHLDGCRIDAALKSAGFPDQQSRDAARALLAENP